jgi:phosphoglucomutase
MTARTGQDPAQRYARLTEQHSAPVYARIDAPASPAQKTRLKRLGPDDIRAEYLAGDPITNVLTRAPGNDAEIGGIKIETRRGWFAARPSGTENVYKIYAESFEGADHLSSLQSEAREMVTQALAD